MSFAADTTSEVELTCATPPLDGEISKVIKGMSEVQCEEWCKYLEWCSANDAELDMLIERDLRDRLASMSGDCGVTCARRRSMMSDEDTTQLMTALVYLEQEQKDMERRALVGRCGRRCPFFVVGMGQCHFTCDRAEEHKGICRCCGAHCTRVSFADDERDKDKAHELKRAQK